MNNIAAAHPMVRYACQVTGIVPLSPDAFEVELQTPESTTLSYHAGQYLQLELEASSEKPRQPLLYSIANAFDPERPCRLQLFIHNRGEVESSTIKRLFQIHENNEDVTVTLPMGKAFLQTDLNLVHVLVAAGSGISQIKCLVEEIVKQQPDAHINLYWSNKQINDFYLLDEFQCYPDNNENLSFTPILESADAGWSGRSGYIYEVIQEDFKHLDKAQVYLCGSPQMVYGTIDRLKTLGLNEDHCYSDVFEYAPRN